MMADSPRNRRKHRRKQGNLRNNTENTALHQLRRKSRRNRNKLRKNGMYKLRIKIISRLSQSS